MKKWSGKPFQRQRGGTSKGGVEGICLGPKHLRAYYTQGEAYRMQGDYDRAIADASEAVRLDPTDAFAYGTRGDAYRMKGEYDRAVADLMEALRLAPGNDWANKQLERAKRGQR